MFFADGCFWSDPCWVKAEKAEQEISRVTRLALMVPFLLWAKETYCNDPLLSVVTHVRAYQFTRGIKDLGEVLSYIGLGEQPYFPTRPLRSADRLLLRVPRIKQVCRGDSVFSAYAPKLWNSLHIRSVSSVAVFKSFLKTYLYDLSLNCWYYVMV